MPEYTLLSLVFLAGAFAWAWLAGVLRERAAWLGLVAFGAITILADLALTGLPIVTYGRAFNLGVAIGPMPVEDLLYGLALYLVAIAAWGRRPAVPAGHPAVSAGGHQPSRPAGEAAPPPGATP